MLRTALALALLASPALADEPRAPKMPRPEPGAHVSAYGRENAACLEWTNACQVCTRETAGAETHCSTPGIACTPGKATCTRR